MTNGEYGGRLAGEILTAAAAVYQWPALQLEEKSWIALTEAEQQRYAGSYDLAEGEESFKHVVKPHNQCLAVSGPLFPETVFYFEKQEADVSYFVAPSGTRLSFSADAEGLPVLVIAGYRLNQGDGG